MEFDDFDATDDDDAVACEQCGVKVSPFELPEHLDFHVAQDLERQMRKESMQVTPNSIIIFNKILRSRFLIKKVEIQWPNWGARQLMKAPFSPCRKLLCL